jgi:hypothetical protein
MGKVLTNLSFENWLRHIFDHPVTDPVWHWNFDADTAELDPLQLIDYSRRLFERAGELLTRYSDGQADQGLWLLIGEGGPLRVLADESVPLEPRVHCIKSVSILFEQCFFPRCTPHLSHFREAEAGVGELNSVCYMWWDIFPFWGQPEDPAREDIDATCLSVMETTLRLPSIACQQSALHGLGHWGLAYKDRCESIISAFLQNHRDLRSELRKYAELAKQCRVL